MDDQQRQRLAAHRQAEAEREASAQEEADLRELEAHDLAASLEGKHGKRGVDFEVINNALGGVYAIRKPDTRANRNWEQASEKSRLSLEWMIGLLRHYIIEPDEKAPGKANQWMQACGARPGLCWQTAEKFVEMMGIDREAAQKK
jgi:hypothetical protein